MAETKVVHCISIEDLLLRAHKEADHIKKHQQEAHSWKIRMGRTLNELRERVEAGENGINMRWWDWYEKHFAYSRSHAEHVMGIARAADPVVASIKANADNRAAVQRHRDKKKQDGTSPYYSNMGNNPIESKERSKLKVVPLDPTPQEQVDYATAEKIMTLLRSINRPTRLWLWMQVKRLYREL